MLARNGGVSLWRELAKNPLVLATLAGLMWNVVGLPLPEAAGQFLGRLAEAAIALGLLAVGAPTPAPCSRKRAAPCPAEEQEAARDRILAAYSVMMMTCLTVRKECASRMRSSSCSPTSCSS